MAIVVRYTPGSLADLDEARAYIAENRPHSAVMVIARIGDAIRSLSEFPYLGRTGRIVGTREFVVRNTPFVIAYRIVGERLDILAVVHGARKWPQAF